MEAILGATNKIVIHNTDEFDLVKNMQNQFAYNNEAK